MTNYQLTIGPTDEATAEGLYEDVRELGVRSEKVEIEEVSADV